jgi:hypothetical protein
VIDLFFSKEKGYDQKSLFMGTLLLLDMCTPKSDEKTLKEAREIAKMKRWRDGAFGKRKRLGKARIVSGTP